MSANGLVIQGSTKKSARVTYGRAQPDDDPALLIVAANPNRVSLTIVNEGTVKCFFGDDSSVTALTGTPLGAGGILEDVNTTVAYYGITASGTADLRYWED